MKIFTLILHADYITVFEDRPIMSVNTVSQFQRTLQHGLSVIAELLVYSGLSTRLLNHYEPTSSWSIGLQPLPTTAVQVQTSNWDGTIK